MMVLVRNDNAYDYKEKFRGEEIKIPANKAIEMEYEDAVLFLGSMNSIKRDVDGNPLPESYKRLTIIKDPEKIAKMMEEKIKLVCQFCGFKAENQDELDKHIIEEHPNSIQDEKVLKDLKKKHSK